MLHRHVPRLLQPRRSQVHHRDTIWHRSFHVVLQTDAAIPFSFSPNFPLSISSPLPFLLTSCTWRRTARRFVEVSRWLLRVLRSDAEDSASVVCCLERGSVLAAARTFRGWHASAFSIARNRRHVVSRFASSVRISGTLMCFYK